MNEQSILFLKKCLNNNEPEYDNFNILDCLDSLMEVLSLESQLNNTLLTLETEACSLKDVSSDKKIFELLIISIITYLAKNCPNSDLRTKVKLKCPSATGFILSFEIIGKNISKASQEELNKILMKDDSTIIHSCHHEISVYNYRIMLELLNGSINTQSVDDSTIQVHMDIPFDSPIVSKEPVLNFSIKLFKRKKINEYTTQWLGEFLSTNDSPLLGISSPGQAKRFDFVRLQQPSKMSNSYQIDKQKLIDRLIREQVENKSEASTLLGKQQGTITNIIFLESLLTNFTPDPTANELSRETVKTFDKNLSGNLESSTLNIKSNDILEQLKKRLIEENKSMVIDTTPEEDKKLPQDEVDATDIKDDM